MSASTVVALERPGRPYADMDGVVHDREDEREDTDVGGIAAERLRSIVERIERLEEEKKAIQNDIKDVMAEAKSAGFVPRILKRILKIRAMKPEDVEEEDNLIPLYMRALGMR